MLVSFVVLNYYSTEDVLKLYYKLEELSSKINCKLIIVNNGDSYENNNMLSGLSQRSQFVHYYSLQNVGYANGNNLGIKVASKFDSEYIVVCNPDVFFDPKILFKKLESCYGSLDNETAVYAVRVEGLSEYVERPNLTRILYPFLFRFRSASEPSKYVFRFHGCFFVITKNYTDYCSEFFDPETFLYYEEDLACFNLSARGYKVELLNGFYAKHEGSKVVNSKIKYKQYKFQFDSLSYLLRKEFGVNSYISWALAFTSITCRFAINTIRSFV